MPFSLPPPGGALLTRAARGQGSRGGTRSPYGQVGAEAHGEGKGSQRQLQEMVVDVEQLQAPEHGRPDGRGGQQESVEPCTRGNTDTLARPGLSPRQGTSRQSRALPQLSTCWNTLKVSLCIINSHYMLLRES